MHSFPLDKQWNGTDKRDELLTLVRQGHEQGICDARSQQTNFLIIQLSG